MTISRVFLSLALIAFLGSGCNRTTIEETANQPPGGSVTRWTSKSELFMEYPALVTGKESRFAVHLTWVSDFKAVTEGKLTLRFSSATGNQQETMSENPTSPGIFRPTLTFIQPGTYRLTMIIDGTFRDTLEVEGLQVFASLSDVPPEVTIAQGEQRIPFLKEQQWKIDFRTEPVVRKPFSSTVRAAAEIIPRLNNDAIVSAPFTGTITADQNETLPVIGQNVDKGMPLATMIPSAETPSGIGDFSSRFIEAETNRSLTEKEFERAKRLRQIDGISEKEYQEAESEFKRADATYQTLGKFVQSNSDHQSPGTFTLRSPLSGTITEMHVAKGKQIDAGEPLYRIIDTRSVWILANVASTEITKFASPKNAWLQLAGSGDVIEINERNSRLVSVANVIDPATRTFPVVFEVRNTSGRLRIGMFGEISIASAKEKLSLVVPESALIEEEGHYSVFVHVEGEAFTKRNVILGNSNGDYVEVLNGLSEGERIVTVGAYQVRLASLSSQLPAHGHEH